MDCFPTWLAPLFDEDVVVDDANEEVLLFILVEPPTVEASLSFCFRDASPAIEVPLDVDCSGVA